MNIYTYIYRLLLFSSCLDLIKIGLSTFHTANLNWAYVLFAVVTRWHTRKYVFWNLSDVWTWYWMGELARSNHWSTHDKSERYANDAVSSFTKSPNSTQLHFVEIEIKNKNRRLCVLLLQRCSVSLSSSPNLREETPNKKGISFDFLNPPFFYSKNK